MPHNYRFQAHQWNRPLATRHLPVIERTFTHPIVTWTLIFIMTLFGVLLLAAAILAVTMIVH